MLKVAVVDTGLDLTDPRLKDHLCSSGHKNFVKNQTLEDVNGHGTFVAGLIEQYAKNGNYCLLIYKYYDDSESGMGNLEREVLAFQEAIDNEADIINLSAGGSSFDELEYITIKNNPNVTFVISAGNDGENLDLPGNKYFPASYWLKNEVVVENINEDGTLAHTSNYSVKTNVKEVGENSLSYFPHDRAGYLSGTSMSAAIHTGKLIDIKSKSCNYKSREK